MLYRIVVACAVAGVVLAQPASNLKPSGAAEASTPPKVSQRSAEHILLGELAGDFDVRVLMYPGPEGIPVELAATAKRTMLLDGLFLEETLDAPSAPTPFVLRTTFGFNPAASASRRFELMRLSSHSAAMMPEVGSFDRSTKLFTFRGQYTTSGAEGSGHVVRTRTVMQITSAESATIDVYTAMDPVPDADPKKDPALPVAQGVPEYKAYSLEYTRKR